MSEDNTGVNAETVKKIARLSRLHVEEDRLAHLADEMNGILAWIEQLGEVDRFEAFRPAIMNPGSPFPYDEVATRLKMTPSGAKSAAFRLKSRFRELFRATVAQLVDSPNEVDDEIEYLIQAMSFTKR